MDELAERLERLERSCRRWRWAGVVFALLVGTPIALLFFVAFLTRDGINETQGLVVRDEGGTARIDVGTFEDGTPRIGLRGRDGEVRLELSLGQGDFPTVKLSDGGKSRLSLAIDERGPTVRLNDRAEASRLLLTVADDDSPVVGLRGGDGEFLLSMRSDPDGTSRIDFVDKDGKPRLAIAQGKGGEPAIGLMDEDGKVRFGISLDKDGKPSITPSRP